MDSDTVNKSRTFKKDRRSREKYQRQYRHSPGDHSLKNNANVCSLSCFAPRLYQNNDSPFSAMPSIVGIPIETCQPFPMFQFSGVKTTQTIQPVPPVRKNRNSNVQSSLPGGQQRINEQEYASLPHVMYDSFSDKSSDSDTNSKRHFSDPGVGQASSDESQKSLRSEQGRSGLLYITLVEEVRDLKDSRKKMMTDLTALRDELNELKMKTCSHCLASEYQPGSLSDAIGDLRKAAQLREDAMLAKLDMSVEASSAELREMLKEAVEKISMLESKLEKLESRNREEEKEPTNANEASVVTEKEKSPVTEKLVETSVPDAFRMLHSLEQEKKKLEENLKEAVAGRNEAEANTQRLERLVAILRTKINGLSTETTLTDENFGRTATNSLERNPFIVMDSLGKTHVKVSSENHVSDSLLKPYLADSKSEKSSSPSATKKTNTTTSLTANPSVPAKPNFSHLPKPAAKLSNNGTHHVKGDGGNPKPNAHSAKFAIGKAVSPPSANKKHLDCHPDSSVDNQFNSISTLPVSLTITGPVTDL